MAGLKLSREKGTKRCRKLKKKNRPEKRKKLSKLRGVPQFYVQYPVN